METVLRYFASVMFGGKKLDSDRAIGALIVVGVIVLGILYFGSFLFPWSLLAAIKVLVSAAFLVVIGIGGWIGWTMMSTPSPEPVDDIDEELDEEFDEDFSDIEESEDEATTEEAEKD